jgi:outer membrane protease
MSQLLWNIDHLIYAGLELDFSWQIPKNSWGLFSNISAKFGFPGETGVMEDRDWIDADYPNWLTHYSVHSNNTDRAVFIDAAIGASFPVFNSFLLKPFLGYDYMEFSWTANGGSFLYPGDNGHRYLLVPMDVITYTQIWNIFSLGIAFYGSFNQYFDIELSFKASPFIWCYGNDNHIMRDLIITSDLSGGFFIEPSLVFSYTPTDIFTLSFTFNYKNISGTRGDSTYKRQGSTPPVTDHYQNIAGAAYHAFDIGLVGKFNISW